MKSSLKQNKLVNRIKKKVRFKENNEIDIYYHVKSIVLIISILLLLIMLFFFLESYGYINLDIIKYLKKLKLIIQPVSNNTIIQQTI